jgi:SAM-dependent methyltransferase
MINEQTTIDSTDISPKNFQFNPKIGTSLRDRLRDFANTLIRRPIYKVMYANKFSNLPYQVNLILPEKGMSTIARRQWVDQYKSLRDARILVIGCGSAWDFGSYLRFSPREIVGVDLYNFSSCWQQVQNYTKIANLPTQVKFIQSDIAALANMNLGDFDIICSDAVFEHCRDLENVLKNLYSLLSPEGIMYASYGALWYSWGGDHFSGRGGIQNGYNHLLMSSSEYESYYQTYLMDDIFELQNGGRYVKLDLFSKLSGLEYIQLYKKTKFNCKFLIVEFTKEGELALQKYPNIYNQLTEALPNLNYQDFTMKSHMVILSK